MPSNSVRIMRKIKKKNILNRIKIFADRKTGLHPMRIPGGKMTDNKKASSLFQATGFFCNYINTTVLD